MPIMTIDGVSVQMTVAEFVEYQRLSKQQVHTTSANITAPAKKQTPTPTPAHMKPEVSTETRSGNAPTRRTPRHDESERERVELQNKGYANAIIVVATMVFLQQHTKFTHKFPDRDQYNLGSRKGRYEWLMARDDETVKRYAEFARVSNSILRSTASLRNWPGSLMAALWAVEVCYGPERSQEVLTRLATDAELQRAVIQVNAEAFTKGQLLPGNTRVHLRPLDKIDLFESVFLLISEQEEK